MADENRRFDIRMLERNIAKGLITREEYDEHVKGLEDVADNAAPVEIKFEAADDEDAPADEAE